MKGRLSLSPPPLDGRNSVDGDRFGGQPFRIFRPLQISGFMDQSIPRHGSSASAIHAPRDFSAGKIVMPFWQIFSEPPPAREGFVKLVHEGACRRRSTDAKYCIGW